jgi:hypothetical protein
VVPKPVSFDPVPSIDEEGEPGGVTCLMGKAVGAAESLREAKCSRIGSFRPDAEETVSPGSRGAETRGGRLQMDPSQGVYEIPSLEVDLVDVQDVWSADCVPGLWLATDE